MPLAAHLVLGSRWTFVGGKGGVGKTTVAAALALELADAGDQVMVLSTDPAHSLGDAFGTVLSAEPHALSDAPGVEAFEIDAAHEHERFFREHGPSIAALLERGTYLDSTDVSQVSDLPVPGMDELGALLRLGRLADEHRSRVILDTAPTGHTLRLLELPRLALGWVEALEAMEAKHAAVASAFAGASKEDAATVFIRDLRSELEKLEVSFRDAAETRFVLVTTTEPAVLAETARYRGELEGRGIALGGIVRNRLPRSLPDATVEEGVVHVPWLSGDLDGIAGLRRFAAAATATLERSGAERDEDHGPTADGPSVGGTFHPPLDRRLYFVGGKGGVGKTTVAAAIAIRVAAEREGPALLLSVDPAGSLSEVLDSRVGPRVATSPGFEPLLAQQLDAGAAWKEFTEQYRHEVQELFSRLGGESLTATLDRDVLERLIDLAPPGVDELMAIVEVIDSIEDGEYDALILDTAPTGHFLRLLEMPELALEWTHSLLRLLLKYRDVVRLEGLGARVLELARALRRLRAIVSDEAATWVVIVALPESLSVPETARLLPRLRSLGLVTGALLVNRALSSSGELLAEASGTTARLLKIDPEIPAGAAPLLASGPVGRKQLADFLDQWREIGNQP